MEHISKIANKELTPKNKDIFYKVVDLLSNKLIFHFNFLSYKNLIFISFNLKLVSNLITYRSKSHETAKECLKLVSANF